MFFRRFVLYLSVLALLAAVVCPGGLGEAAALSYYVGVDLTNQIVTVYSTADDTIVRQMLCSAGRDATTPTGTFTMPRYMPSSRLDRKEWVYYYKFHCYVQYPTRIRGDILFHSLPYLSKSHEYIQQSAYRTFGKPTSHGCIRLRWQDAKFICENCPPGTKVIIYRSNQPDEGLRGLLMQSTFSIDDGIPYERFMAIPESADELGRGSQGPEVSDLQSRLRNLGYFSGETSGEYLIDTINAVKQVQADLGLDETGVTSPELRELVFSTDAPTAMNITLKEGANGPTVRKLQQNLADLCLYEGDLDSVYDVDAADAVGAFQDIYAYARDGIATPEVQKAISYEAERMRLLCPDAATREMARETFTLSLGQVTAKNGLRIRKGASTSAEPLNRLALGDVVLCLEHGSSWSKIQSGKCIGFVTNDFVKFSPREMTALVYTDGEGGRYALGGTEADYLSGAGLPSVRFAEYLASDGSLESFSDLRIHARVNTPGGVPLNLRDAPDGAVVGQIPDGTELDVASRKNGWSQVTYDGQTGYVTGTYLTFRAERRSPEELQAEEQAEAEEIPEEEIIPAVVQSYYKNSAPVYSLDSDDASVLGHLKTGIAVEVLETADGWNLIRLNGRTGYMRDEDLKLSDAALS